MNNEDRLGIISLESYSDKAKRINHILCDWRKHENYLIDVQCPRFASGEAKAMIKDSVRDKDIYILVDVCNNSLKYKMDGELNRMSPDDHYQDLKRVIAACNGKAKRITVIMPFLYESRQHRKTGRESLDCALMLKEMEFLGVNNIVTFDAHDPRVANSTPLKGFDNFTPPYQFMKALLASEEDLLVEERRFRVE